MSEKKTALAIFAHPDDIEFCAAGTLLLLSQHGWATHYLNLSSGDLGSFEYDQNQTRAIRRMEAKTAAQILGATYHESICNDMGVSYTVAHVCKVAALIRKIQPGIILTHSPSDYMEDHQDASRIAVSAAFTRGMPNFETNPKQEDDETRRQEDDEMLPSTMPCRTACETRCGSVFGQDCTLTRKACTA